MDYELMPPFEYDLNRTRAMVKFQAHKFPYTSSVYYQCNVRLCLRNGGCDEVTPSLFKKETAYLHSFLLLQPPLCDAQGNNLRRKRQIESLADPKAEYRIDDPFFAQNATIEVFGGFYVTDTTDNRDTRLFDSEPLDEVMAI